eukprot:3570970-Alexandrium_andersonii.AAC.1
MHPEELGVSGLLDVRSELAHGAQGFPEGFGQDTRSRAGPAPGAPLNADCPCVLRSESPPVARGFRGRSVVNTTRARRSAGGTQGAPGRGQPNSELEAPENGR